MAKKKKCPCCGKMIDTRGFKVHVFFCCSSNKLPDDLKSKLLKIFTKK